MLLLLLGAVKPTAHYLCGVRVLYHSKQHAYYYYRSAVAELDTIHISTEWGRLLLFWGLYSVPPVCRFCQDAHSPFFLSPREALDSVELAYHRHDVCVV